MSTEVQKEFIEFSGITQSFIRAKHSDGRSYTSVFRTSDYSELESGREFLHKYFTVTSESLIEPISTRVIPVSNSVPTALHITTYQYRATYVCELAQFVAAKPPPVSSFDTLIFTLKNLFEKGHSEVFVSFTRPPKRDDFAVIVTNANDLTKAIPLLKENYNGLQLEIVNGDDDIPYKLTISVSPHPPHPPVNNDVPPPHAKQRKTDCDFEALVKGAFVYFGNMKQFDACKDALSMHANHEIWTVVKHKRTPQWEKVVSFTRSSTGTKLVLLGSDAAIDEAARDALLSMVTVFSSLGAVCTNDIVNKYF